MCINIIIQLQVLIFYQHSKYCFLLVCNYRRSSFTGALHLLVLCNYWFRIAFSYRCSDFTGACYLLALLVFFSNAKCTCNGLFSSCQKVYLNGNTNSFRNICMPENILTFLNGTNASCRHTHPYTNILHFLRPASNKTVQGSWDSY